MAGDRAQPRDALRVRRRDGVDAVRAFHATALELGAESLHEPRLWPEYHPGYYGAFVRDPDGNNVEAVFHRGRAGRLRRRRRARQPVKPARRRASAMALLAGGSSAGPAARAPEP